MQAISIRFPEEIYQLLRKESYELHKPMNTIVVEAVKKELEKHEAKDK